MPNECERLERELEELRAEKREAEEASLREYEERQRGRKERFEMYLRDPREWSDAFAKQEILLKRELGHPPIPEDDPYHADAADSERFFREALEVNAKAQAVWPEVACKLAEYRRQLLSELADQLESELSGKGGVQDLANCLRNDDPQAYVNW